jgi:hypothetical protein
MMFFMGMTVILRIGIHREKFIKLYGTLEVMLDGFLPCSINRTRTANKGIWYAKFSQLLRNGKNNRWQD